MRFQWEEVQGFPDYQINQFGTIVNTYTDRTINPRINQQGVLMTTLFLDGRQKTRSVGLLVARTFVENPNPKWFDSIIYLNGERQDCRAANIRWRSRPFALAYHAMLRRPPWTRPVEIIETGERFATARELCMTYGLLENQVMASLDGREHCWPERFDVREWNE